MRKTILDFNQLVTPAKDEAFLLDPGGTNEYVYITIANLIASILATELNYTPNDSAQWRTTPTQIQAALDELAVKTGYKAVSITSANSPYTVLTTSQVILVDTTSGAVVVNLPAITTLKNGQEIVVVHSAGANSITINRGSTDLINDSLTSVLSSKIGTTWRLRVEKAALWSAYTSVPTGATFFEKELQFASDLDTVRETTFRGVVTFVDAVCTTGIDATALQFETSTDDGATWTSRADLAAVNTFIAGSVTGNHLTGTHWRLRVTATYESGIVNMQSVNLIYTR